MVFTRFGCDVCKYLYKSEAEAKACEKKEFPVLPKGLVFINRGDKDRRQKDLLVIIGDRIGIQESTHHNVYRSATIMESTPDNYYNFNEFYDDNSSERVENPREELKNHPLFQALEVILSKGIYDGLRELHGKEWGELDRAQGYDEEKVKNNKLDMYHHS